MALCIWFCGVAVLYWCLVVICWWLFGLDGWFGVVVCLVVCRVRLVFGLVLFWFWFCVWSAMV